MGLSVSPGSPLGHGGHDPGRDPHFARSAIRGCARGPARPFVAEVVARASWLGLRCSLVGRRGPHHDFSRRWFDESRFRRSVRSGRAVRRASRQGRWCVVGRGRWSCHRAHGVGPSADRPGRGYRVHPRSMGSARFRGPPTRTGMVSAPCGRRSVGRSPLPPCSSAGSTNASSGILSPWVT